ncbi:MAG: hypothetical protein WCY78_00960 [Sphaerochaetaceae bacterium]
MAPLRVACCVLILVLLSSPLMARHRQTTFEATMYNDNLTFGMGENPDDLRSYGMKFIFFHTNGWGVDLEFSGLTHRQEDKRFDEIILQGGYLLHFHLQTKAIASAYDILLHGGLTLAGDFGFKAVQNFIHDVFSIEALDGNYEGGGERKILPLMGLNQKFELIKNAPWFENSELFFWAELNTSYTPTYMAQVYPKISVGQHTLSNSMFLVGLGYAFVDILDDWETHHIVGEIESGLILHFKGYIGLLTFGYNWYVDAMEGYGGVGVQLVFDDKTAWQRSDLLLSVGLAIPNTMTTVILRYHLYKDLGIYFKNAFKMTPLADDGRVRENYSTWHTGIDWEISKWDFGWARPFVMGGIGLNRFLVMGDGASGRHRLLSEAKFSTEAALGLRFFNKGEFQYRGSSYGLELSGGYLLNANKAVGLDGYILKFAEIWRPYFKIAFTVGTLL